jgi:hypothetical protein
LKFHPKKVEDLLNRFPSVVRADGSTGQTSFAIHRIEAPDFRTFCETPSQATEIHRQVDELLAQVGLCRMSLS